jgi:SAM-dependent methyltransferase
MLDFTFRLHPEKNIDNFTTLDGTLKFYQFVKSIMLGSTSAEVIDFGAGRGAFWYDDPSLYRKQMRDLRMPGAIVTACDVDEVVLTHPCSHKQVVIKPDKPLPFADETFDLLVSDMTFEHIENPSQISQELLRIMKPHGYLCVRTVNRFGYVRVMAELIPSGLHLKVIAGAQGHRKLIDVFPAYSRLNSLGQIRQFFPECEVYHYFDSADPAYYFGSELVYRTLQLWHKLAPSFFATSVCFFIRKPGGR